MSKFERIVDYRLNDYYGSYKGISVKEGNVLERQKKVLVVTSKAIQIDKEKKNKMVC